MVRPKSDYLVPLLAILIGFLPFGLYTSLLDAYMEVKPVKQAGNHNHHKHLNYLICSIDVVFFIYYLYV